MMDWRRQLDYLLLHYQGQGAQRVLARDLGAHVNSLRNWLNGLNPNAESQARIAELYHRYEGEE